MRVSSSWLALREPADAAARCAELVEHLPGTAPWVVHDLGCGTGSMSRWLAPQLSGPQHWVLHDTDADLLERATIDLPAVTAEPRVSDVTRLQPADLAGATLITASALLDILTAEELAALLAAGVRAGCPMLLTLSVVGHVELAPADPLDRRVAAAFDAHQRRVTERGCLLGPDAVAAAVEELRGTGAEVLVRASPWRLDAAHAELATEWLCGWVGAACEQDPALDAGAYLDRRLEEAAAGELSVIVGHADLLVAP